MKTTKIIYWVSTTIVFLFDGVMPALTSNTELARQGISHLGYPDYFRVMLTFFKVIGAIGLMLPAVKGRYKEWIYAGFGINFICAAISHAAVDGFNFQVFFPLIIFAILIVSYTYYNKLNKLSEYNTNNQKLTMSQI